MPLALLALSVVAFGIGTTEFVSMGLLPQIADGVGVSVPQAGTSSPRTRSGWLSGRRC